MCLHLKLMFIEQIMVLSFSRKAPAIPLRVPFQVPSA